jgi:O-antigen/teichoic acid export membrane protein
LIILVQSDILMVGSFIGPGAAGIYNAAAKTSVWVGFVLDIVNMVAAPAFATLYTQGDIQGLQKVVFRVSVWIFWPSLVIALCLLVFTQPVLSLFGRDFIAGSWALKVLVLGKFVGALCGSVGNLMVMTGHQKKSLPVSAWCALINLVGNAIAIPKLGIVGAAISTSCTLVLWNIWLSILVVKHVGVRPWVFYNLFVRENQSMTPPTTNDDNGS